jgi:uncharacterized membrane protein
VNVNAREGLPLKTRTINILIASTLLSILLIPLVLYIPSTIARIILGIPFILFFPGYALVAALFIDHEGMDTLERLALSFGLSIIIVALIGLGWNYTAWGIRLEPVMYSIGGFTLIVSVIALARISFSPHREPPDNKTHIRLPAWKGSRGSKLFSIWLILCLIGAIAALGYTFGIPKPGEKYTEFYLLGFNNRAQDYPSEFLLQNGQVISVKYGPSLNDNTNPWGKVTLGIVNHEQGEKVYTISMAINEQPAKIYFESDMKDKITSIELPEGQKWEHEIGFSPSLTGDEQKVEFWLFQGDSPVPSDSLRLWFKVSSVP